MAKKRTTSRKSKHQPIITWQRVKPLVKWGSVAFVALAIYICWDMPGTDEVKPLDSRPSITVLSNDGTLIARYGGMQGNLINVDDLPPYVPQAIMAIEDRRFYSHFGVDPIGLMRAMWVNIRAGHWAQGGSTLTQQLAKNLFLTPDKTLRRKIQEALLALQIEYKYSKSDIFSAYLNRVYFGAGAYGIDSAAKTYFGKPAQKLTLWEGATLAGVLKAPSRFSPSADPKKSRERAKVVISAMEDAGFITAKEKEKEIKQASSKKEGGEIGDYNRYFADWVINQIDGFVSNTDRDLIVKTSIDARLQKMAEQRQEAIFKQLKPEEKITQVALVTLSKDGAILAMLGGQDYSKSQYNRAVQAQRQPGSSFKPFVYLAALEAGWAPDDIIDDAPIKTGSYRPENHEGKYYGPVTLTQALAFSLNTSTIRLLSNIGMSRLLDVTQRLGFTHSFKAELATGLGADETNLLELTNAYAVIGNGGHAIWPYAVLSIEDTKKNVLYVHEQTDHATLFNGQDIRDLDSMLVQVVAQGTGQAAQLSRGHVAGKTGTSQNYRDAWFVGYTDKLVTGVWMGNDDDSPMQRISGGRYPARLWHDFMSGAIDVNVPNYANFDFTPDYSVQSEELDRAPRFLGDGETPPAQEGEVIQDNSQQPSGGNDFGSMLQRWSTDAAPQEPQKRIKGSTSPVYNP